MKKRNKRHNRKTKSFLDKETSYYDSMGIEKITKKEYARIKHEQDRGIHNCLVFTHKNSCYRCDETGAAGLKKIAHFIKNLSAEEKNQQALGLILNQEST